MEGLGEIGEYAKREGVNPKVVKIFYRVETNAVLLFGLETWLLLAAMEITVDGTHARFLIQITRNWGRQKSNGTSATPEVEEF